MVATLSASIRRILVVDDRTVTRAGYRTLFKGKSDLDVVGDAADIKQAVNYAVGLRPDVVVVDSHPSSFDAAEMIKRIGAEVQEDPPPVLILVDEFDERIRRLLRAGARGILLSRSTPDEIVSAVRLVAAGYTLLFPRCGLEPVDGGPAPSGDPRDAEGDAVLGRLTPREADVLRLIARGCSNAEISAALFVSESTVKSHVQRMLDKLELRNRVHAVIYAYKIGIVHAGTPSLPPRGTTQPSAFLSNSA